MERESGGEQRGGERTLGRVAVREGSKAGLGETIWEVHEYLEQKIEDGFTSLAEVPGDDGDGGGELTEERAWIRV